MKNNIIIPTKVPEGEVLMVHPPYVHYAEQFVRDRNPFLPVGLLYAGQLLEASGKTKVKYHDSQLHDLEARTDLHSFNAIGINAMGTQNIAPAYTTFTSLLQRGVDPNKVYLGGQGVEGLTLDEFQRVFPGANLVSREALGNTRDYWNTSIRDQLEKFSPEDMRTYLTHELTLLFSQGCKYGCTFCGAQVNRQETFYNTTDNLRAILEKSQELGIPALSAYVTSLDFFQQSLKGGDLIKLKKQLEDIIALEKEFGIPLRLRALTRADSYMEATRDPEMISLAKQAGFYQFGFGADGAANTKLLKAMHKGTADLESRLLQAFPHTEQNGFTPEILYVFGIEADTSETLTETGNLCIGLLNHFPTSIYRGFPAKDNIPGNAHWSRESWKRSEAYQKLLSNPQLFANLGFEALANNISHPNEEKRKQVNAKAIEMSHAAHRLGRVQSFLTIPFMDTDVREVMDEQSFETFKEIVSNYAPHIAPILTRENLPEHRAELNRLIPKDK